LRILALDTTEMRGSVALLAGGQVRAARRHDTNVDYSEWLLPAVGEVMGQDGGEVRSVELVAVATGPGSFTGLRVGLTTAKAWAEVYGMPIVGVSRLEAMAQSVQPEGGGVAAFYDAQRGQVFGGLYTAPRGGMAASGEEVVLSPEEFLGTVAKAAGRETVRWVSLDPELVADLAVWKARQECGDTMESCDPQVAVAIGRLAERRARAGLFSDPLELDANYVRRSDAEIFWKGR